MEMAHNVPCITCRRNLLDTGQYDQNRHGFAFCTVCNAYYQIVPVLDDNGEPRFGPTGDAYYYLNPVKPGRAEFAREDDFGGPERTLPDAPKKTDFSKLLEKIQNATSPQDLID